VAISTVFYPRWPPLLKIEISSNGQNCSLLSQKVPKFELYKHNEKGTTQGSFQQSLVEIGSVVSEERIFFKFHPPFFLICIIGQNRQKFKVHKKCPNLNCISIMMSFLTYITGFFMNFELLPILTNYAN
jgi:hypothetical protein